MVINPNGASGPGSGAASIPELADMQANRFQGVYVSLLSANQDVRQRL
jgi:hypothetical protein